MITVSISWFDRAHEAQGQVGLHHLMQRVNGMVASGTQQSFVYMELRACSIEEMTWLVAIAEADGWQQNGIPTGTIGHWADCRREHEAA